MTDAAEARDLPKDVTEIAIQSASWDIWDKKYRLKAKDGRVIDETVDDTYKRVAWSLAQVEETEAKRHEWYEKFVWALRQGAIPAGRITSNAGAEEHKPATSTINCTVSGTVGDSMDDILQKVHEAGLTLKAGCGIGYEFSTLRHKGAYVSGAGAYTSGALSFMDIYDRMCFTVSSAGGRRGAQMATFDVGHPDVLDFIRAKREDGRLRQFNLSLLITDEFIEAVRNDEDWALAFPVSPREVEVDGIDVNDPSVIRWRYWPRKEGYVTNEEGLVACRIERTVKAKRLWDMIMTSTYDFAEPGFILIDRVNEMNNNWFDEDIRATNPCVTADTWVQTDEGPRQVSELIGRPFRAIVDGVAHDSGAEGFFRTDTKGVVRLQTAEGYALRLTEDHRVRRVSRFTRYSTETEWCAAGDLRNGDRVLLNNHRQLPEWEGELSEDEGYLLGLLVGDGTLKQDKAVLSTWAPAAVANGDDGAPSDGVQAVMARAEAAARELGHRADFRGWQAVGGRSEWRLSTAALKALSGRMGMTPEYKGVTTKIERSSARGHAGFIRGLFDADGSVQGSQAKGVSVRLAQSDIARLEGVQRMLLRLGVTSTIYRDRRANAEAQLPDGNGGTATYAIQDQHELVISGEDLAVFAERVGFGDSDKQSQLETALAGYTRALNRTRFVTRVIEVEADGEEDVYDVQVPGINSFDANGLHAHNCGEQPLPPYGACLLGSVNLTKFVREPFTENAHFDWDTYRDVVAVFTRMLDNVVEVNGLPLPEQQKEIMRKRRHGMGFLGLGSTVTMLRMKYGDADSVAFTEEASKQMALQGWRTAVDLADEKGPAPIMDEDFTVTKEMLAKRPRMAEDGYKVGDQVKGRVLMARYSHYMEKVADADPETVDAIVEKGARFTHHSSIAPTGTISLSLANNASNGIEPSFAHHYYRNVIREGRKSKEKVDVFSFELLAYRSFIDAEGLPQAADANSAGLPDYFITADDVTPKQHVDIQGAAQKWVDSSISKTANVPTDYPYEDFKDIYMYAHEQGLKGCTTFRFNPEAFQGVLVKEEDLANTTYRFQLEDGSWVEAKGGDEIEYDGEMHTAANLYDALKEGYYGKF